MVFPVRASSAIKRESVVVTNTLLPWTAVPRCAAVLTGCSGDDDSTDPPASASSATSTSTSSSSAGGTTAPSGGTDGGDTEGDGMTDAPPFPANTEPDTADSSGDPVTVTEIRIGRHDGFDRVVFEVDGGGTPGWDVRYVDDPASQGSGDPIDVDGAAALQVVLTGIGLPDDTGVEEWSGPNPLSVGATETVTEVAWDATFEGQSVAFVGTTAETPFRVYLLENPVRVVVGLAVSNAEEHVASVANLANVFNDPDAIYRIASAADAAEVRGIFGIDGGTA